MISGCVGPRGDGYNPAELYARSQAEAYHATQIATFAGTAADMVTAITMNYVDGGDRHRPRGARAGMPVAISFTVETDGRLPTGQTLRDAIDEVDAATGRARLLHDQLRAPDALRHGARRAAPGSSASAACAPTRRRTATRSSTRRRSSTTAIRPSSASSYAELKRRSAR